MKVPAVLAFYLATLGCVYSASLEVVGGDEAEPHSIPSQAHLYLESDFLQHWNCTGVLISEHYVLTTSKCQWSGPTKVNVTLGAHNIKEAESSQQSLYTNKAWKIYNVDFVYDTLENNIALVKLPTSVTLNDYVQVAKLPTADDVQVGQTGTISGWGENGRVLETVLQVASASVVNNSVCATAYPDVYTGEKTICVQGDNGASGCNGDGGAPLVIDGVVVGVYSVGPIHDLDKTVMNCTTRPNVFTRVASYLDWIKDNSDI